MPTRVVPLTLLVLILVAGCAGTNDQNAQLTGSPTGDELAATSSTPPAAETPRTDAVEQQSPSTADTETASPSPTATPTSVDWEVNVVAENLQVPWSLAFAPDGTTFFTERDTGALYRVTERSGVEQIDELSVDSSGEGGLLGLAVSPDFAEDGLLYAYRTTSEGNQVVRFRPGDEPEVVVGGIPSASFHNGGRIAFGPDGMLYIGTGDATQALLAQDHGSLAGKILRVTPDGDVPEGNPFDGSPVWSLGHRNVQGFDWDAEGRMYASEFGPDQDDEINRIEAGGNYGWPEVTGEASVEQFIDPIVVRQPPEASWSGLALPIDSQIPQWNGDLLAAALRGERLWRVELDGGEVVGTDELITDEYGRLRVAAQGPDGAIWVGTSNRDGRGSPAPNDDRILRITPPARGR